RKADKTGWRLDGFEMAEISFLGALLLGATALLFREAASQISLGMSWAGEVCSTSQMFCHHPEYIAYAGFALMTVAIGTKLSNLAR
ncbi:MAG: hypothetical protein Q7U92_14260, partial [Bradyrhizobium sp.]|nr:hypothetical protein [Bradyrhizobium sp.]